MKQCGSAEENLWLKSLRMDLKPDDHFMMLKEGPEIINIVRYASMEYGICVPKSEWMNNITGQSYTSREKIKG